MSTMSQKDGVFKAVVSVLGNDEFDGAVELSKDQKAKVTAILFEGFRKGEITLDAEYDDTKMKHYIGGLINNWMRRDKRLNGNTEYVAKNPGVRGNPEVRELTKLLKTVSDPAHIQAIQARIDQLNAEKAATKTVTIDVSKIDDSLKALLGL